MYEFEKQQCGLIDTEFSFYLILIFNEQNDTVFPD